MKKTIAEMNKEARLLAEECKANIWSTIGEIVDDWFNGPFNYAIKARAKLCKDYVDGSVTDEMNDLYINHKDLLTKYLEMVFEDAFKFHFFYDGLILKIRVTVIM